MKSDFLLETDICYISVIIGTICDKIQSVTTEILIVFDLARINISEGNFVDKT